MAWARIFILLRRYNPKRYPVPHDVLTLSQACLNNAPTKSCSGSLVFALISEGFQNLGAKQFSR